MSSERALLERLYELLVDASNGFGEVVEPLDELTADLEVYAVGDSGVAAFFGDYLLAGWPPAERIKATAKTYRLIAERLKERGLIRFMVHSGNFRSIIAVRRLGGLPHGVDKDGYIHYLLTREAFADRGRRTGLKIKAREYTGHGQEVTAAESS